VTFEGRHFRVRDVSIRPKPLQKPRPRIWIGAAADPAVRRAALLGDAWIATSVTTFSAIREQVALYHRTRREAGLPPAAELSKCVELYVAPTRAQALAESLPFIADKYRAYYAWGMAANVPGETGASLGMEQLARDRFVIGTPEDCVHGCLEHLDLGVTHLIVRFNFPGMDPHNVLNAIRLFGREVIPEVRRAASTRRGSHV
jgi:alkanesulfonate monooxygenase SsuD/methylene tetrahydromethanopterin reductase-like flavin-dependent oxidoreductase (luciferase family)